MKINTSTIVVAGSGAFFLTIAILAFARANYPITYTKGQTQIPTADESSQADSTDVFWLRRGEVIATLDSKDLDVWRSAASMQPTDGGEIVHFPDYNRSHRAIYELIDSGRIVELESPAKVCLLSISGQIANVTILNGAHAGKLGSIPKWSLLRRTPHSLQMAPVFMRP